MHLKIINMPKLSNLENLEQLIEKNMDKNIKNDIIHIN